jgi:hypothetical protein
MKSQLPTWVFVAAALAFEPATSTALDLGIRHYGARGGVSVSPDQFHGGLFFDAGRLPGNLRFQPSFDLGFGNGLWLVSANVDALHPVAGGPSMQPYLGGGVGFNFFDVNDGVGAGRGLELEPVLDIVGGLEWGGSKRKSGAPFRYVLEARLGIGDTPDFKVSAGITF